MDNQTVAEEKVVETETTQTSSPQVESPITGDETVQEDEIVQTPLVEESDVTKTMTEEQRRAFQEQRLENKRLKEQLETLPKEASAFEAFRAKGPSGEQTEPVRVENFYDSVTGETNWQAYNLAQQQREQQIVAQAKVEAQSTVQDLLDEERARTKYPELMNNPLTEKQIASRWLYEKIQGNDVKIETIAEEFARNFKQAVSKAEKISTERILNEVSEKEKAGLSAQGQSSQTANQASSQREVEQLGAGTRRGDADAITARISKIPWANK